MSKDQLTFFEDNGAEISDDRRYRYSLWRIWNRKLPAVMFIGLNPSTADEQNDDPTIRRCEGFAENWGYGGIVMTNLFAFRATNPQELFKTDDPIGPENDKWLTSSVASCRIIVAAWGTHGGYQDRDHHVLQLLVSANQKYETAGIFCLGITKQGYPRHPLYLPKTCKPITYSGRS